MKFIITIATYFLALTLAAQSIEVNDAINLIKSNDKVSSEKGYTEVNQLLNGDLTDYDRSRCLYARAYIRQNKNMESALWDYLEALRFLDLSKIDDDASRSGLYNNIARIYKKYSQFDLALKYYKLALEISPESTKKNILYNIANAHRKKGERIAATKRYLEALDYSEKDKNQQAKIYSKIAAIFYDSEEYQKAENYLYNIINLSNEIDTIHIARAYHRLGQNFILKGDTTKAIEQLLKSLSYRSGSDKFISLQDLSEIYMETGQFEKAISVSDLALSYYDQLNEVPTTFDIYRIKAEALFGLGDVPGFKQYMTSYIDASNRYNDLKRNATEEGERLAITYLTDKHQEAVQEQQQLARNTWIYAILITLFSISLYLIYRVARFYQKKKQVEREIRDLQERYSRHL